MREIMISIQPQWVEKILNGEKTIEIRKTMPKCELPCKVYIYETKSKYKKGFYNNLDHKIHYCEYFGKGKVVAEFTCDFILNGKEDAQSWEYISENSCVPSSDLYKYCGENEDGEINYCYGWHIDNLKIYDKPKELSEFTRNVPDYSSGVVMYSLKPEPLKRPFQSWGYINENN